MDRLQATLRRIDGRGYRAYKDLRGEYRFDDFTLFIDHVQGDPFAAPSRIAIAVDATLAGLPEHLVQPRPRRIATEDYLTRRVSAEIGRVCQGGRGSGKSGRVEIDRPHQEVLERTSCLIDEGAIEIRLTAGLPAAGRRVLGREAAALFCDELPELVRRTLLAQAHDLDAMRLHADVVEDQAALRDQLAERALVAFVADGAILPRSSGVDDRPLQRSAVPFGPAPDTLAVEVDLPNAGRVRGLGIGRGVTLIVGGGYHGKSTLLEALARGIYDHIPGDGRERVVTANETVCVRAEDGRRVERVGIDAFITDLPNGVDTRSFSTDRGSGSTSQAAAIMEALETGASALLIDEDTSASNFLVRDHRMQRLVPPDKEPIRPFVDRVRQLADGLQVSTVMVLGGSSDYFEAADRVIHMDAYVPHDVGAAVAQIMADLPSARTPSAAGEITVRHRAPHRAGMNPQSRRKPGRNRVKALDTRAIRLGDQEIDISLLAQIVDRSQTRALADALVYTHDELVDGRRTLREIADELRVLIANKGVCGYAARRHGDRAQIRALDVTAAINRLRSLRVS